MAWVDADYVVNAIGQGQAYSLGLVTTKTGNYTGTDRLTQAEAGARGIVNAVPSFAGYTLTDPLPTDAGYAADVALLKRLTLAVIVRDVYEMVFGVEVGPNAPAVLGSVQRDLNMMFSAKLKLASFAPEVIASRGGASFSQPGTAAFRFLRRTGF